MTISELKEIQNIANDIKLKNLYVQFKALLNELKTRELSQNIIEMTNQNIGEINESKLLKNELKKLIKKNQSVILKRLDKELKIIPKNHYQKRWMLYGISGFGMPVGLIFGYFSNNIGLLGLGLSIGMCAGILVGVALDKKALKNGKQINVEINY